MSIVDLTDFSGTNNQNVADHLLAVNQTPLSINTALDKTGAVGMRMGSELVADKLTGTNTPQGCGTYIKSDGSHELLVVMEGNLYKYVDGVRTLVSSSVVSTTSTVSFANYIGKMYFIGSGDTEYLKKYDGSTVSTVSGNIEGRYLAADDSRLMVSGGGATVAKNRTLYSNIGIETFTTATDYFDTTYPVTGVVSFGEQAPFLLFDEERCYIADPNKTTSRAIAGFGCSSHRSIGVVQGIAIWINRDGMYAFRDTDAYPTKVSTSIENNLTLDAVFNKISGTGFNTAAAGTTLNKYYLSVGDLSGTVKGQTLNDLVIVFDVKQNTMTLRTYTANGLGADWTLYKDTSGNRALYSISRDDNCLYKVDVANVYTDDNNTGVGQSYTALHRTKHLVFAGGSKFSAIGREIEKQLKKGQVKLYNAGNATISYSIDGATTYTALSTVDTATPSGKDWHYWAFNPPTENKLKSISLEISSSSNFILYEWNIDIVSRADIELKAY